MTGFVEKALITSEQSNCDLCTDDRRGKPKLGMEIVRGAKKAEDAVWEHGKIVDPENGKTSTLRMTPLEGGARLQIGAMWAPSTGPKSGPASSKN